MAKAISPMVAVVLLTAFTIGVGGLVMIFLTGTTQTSTGIVKNASESLALCSAAIINVPKDSVYCVSGYNLSLVMRLDESSGTTAADSSGYGNNGVLTNFNFNSISGWTAGRYGNGLMFDGVNDFVNITHSSSLDITGGLTIEGWFNFKSRSTVTDTMLIDKGTTSPNIGYFLDFDNGEGFEFVISGNGTTEGRAKAFSQLKSENNRWYHVVAVFIPSQRMEMWVDGVLEGVNESSFAPAPDGIFSNSANVLIGRDSGGALLFNGTMDEIRIYNRALSASEIKQHYESGITELFGNKSVVKFQLQNNGQYSLGRNFNFALATASASNTTNITLGSDLNAGGTQLVKLVNLTMTPLSVSTVKNLFVTSVVCPNVQLNIKDLNTDC
ncbi:MAG: hypothetical protein HYS62_02755 [Candidatus Aenigmarchaeota archaeon]|nr:hypothetical protein [Candidatus Aenigmarchaeota archaeon]